jgi:hypothetical protein
MRGARLNFIENRIAPLCARLEASERATVRALDPKAVGWFDLDSLPIMQQARRDRLATAKIGFDMGIPFNELNRVLDLGFPPLPHGNTCYLPSTLQTAGRLSSEKAATVRIPLTPAPTLTLTPCPAPGSSNGSKPAPNTEVLKLFRQLHAIITS